MSGPPSSTLVAAPPTRLASSPTTGRRAFGLLAAVLAGTVLGLAAWLQPAGAGLGTHEQLNLPTCGWIILMDVPCPTCGMTTAFAHAADGHLLASLHAQPAGAVLALGTAVVFVAGLATALTGRRVLMPLVRIWGPGAGWWLAGGLVAAWAYKVLTYCFLA